MILTKSHLTFGQITKLQLTRSYLPTYQALASVRGANGVRPTLQGLAVSRTSGGGGGMGWRAARCGHDR